MYGAGVVTGAEANGGRGCWGRGYWARGCWERGCWGRGCWGRGWHAGGEAAAEAHPEAQATVGPRMRSTNPG
eukprot:scaffold138893_cov102-Phaeocystis_antarctica.AAC.2